MLGQQNYTSKTSLVDIVGVDAFPESQKTHVLKSNERKPTPTEIFAFVHIYDAIWWYEDLKAEWLYYKWLSFDCPCWSVKSCESMSLLSLSPAFSNSSARNRSSPPKLTQRLVPSPDSLVLPKFSPGARCFGPTLGTHNDYFQKNTVAINSKPFKSTNHVINYKVNPIFTRTSPACDLAAITISFAAGCITSSSLGGMKH